MSIRLAVLMTVFNRKAQTLSCLESFFGVANGLDDLTAKVFLVDAGTDGTGLAIQSQWADVEVLSGGADTYWAAGMRAAWQEARKQRFDYLMWLNDDVVLLPEWYSSLFRDGILAPRHRDSVIVGSCSDPVSNAQTYGGFDRSPGLNPLRFQTVSSNGAYQLCDTLNGNVVVMSIATDQRVGGFPPHYKHNLADLAYGLNAQRRGVPILVTPGPVGLCARNEISPPSGRMIKRIQQSRQAKKYPFKQWARFCLTYGGFLGVLSVVRPYLRAAMGTKAAIPEDAQC